MSRDKLLTKLEHSYIISLSSIPLIAFFIAFTQQNVEGYTNTAFFVAYFIFICFTLPSFLSKILFKQNFFSLTSALCFLYFPIMYFVNLIIHHLHGFDFQQLYFVSGLLTILFWHTLFVIFVLKERISKVEKTLFNFAYTLIPFAIFLLIIALVRDYGSIISTDILIHKTVLNGMQDPNTFGIMPATYSNTFTGQGYPILMYHTFLNMITNAFTLPFHLVSYFVDLFLTLIFSLVVFRFFTKYYNILWGILGTTLALLTFENLAYTAHFFVPQTLAFLFFLKILTDRKLTLKELSLAGILLILTHFFIGAFLTGFLIVKHLYFDGKLLKKENKSPNFLFLETFLLFAFIILLSAAGFSIEKYFQTETTEWFGNLSNPDFANKFSVLFNLLGALWLLLIYAFFRVLGKKKRSLPELIGYFGVLIALGVYFLSPTFASKFLLGFGFFSSLLLISWFSDINFPRRYLQISIIVIIISAYAFNFSNQFLELTRFLEQEDGNRTALVQKDEPFVQFWQKENPDCVLISDPQTQLAIHSLGEGITARGMYMTLNSREKLANFIREPSQRNLIQIVEIEELENIQKEKICIGISQRLIEMAERNRAWESLISTYQVEHRFNYLETNHNVFQLLDIYPRVYLDDYHAVFLVRGGN